ncbi:MAG: hypothetical protein FD153_147 [Rhodospirillaceae bacterium]|nr:MAG: hypothetical protein FD153_147 [Rhodospirillaceae bacterium]
MGGSRHKTTLMENQPFPGPGGRGASWGERQPFYTPPRQTCVKAVASQGEGVIPGS